MNKKAITQITIVFWLFGGLFVWFLFSGNLLAEWGYRMVELNSLVGFEAFFYQNINVFVFVIMMIAGTAYMYIGSGD